MVRTREAVFLVLEPDSSSAFSSGRSSYVWFQVVEGEDAGKRVRVPLWDESYTEEVERVLATVSEESYVRGELEREDKSELWKPVSLELIGGISLS